MKYALDGFKSLTFRFPVGAMANSVGRPKKQLADDVIKWRYENGDSETSIAKELGVHRNAVHRRLMQLGIPLRSPQEASDLLCHRSFVETTGLRDAIDGLLMGDAWIGEHGGGGESRLAIEQRLATSGWIYSLAQEFRAAGIVATVTCRSPRTSSIGKYTVHGRGSVQLRTGNYVNFTEQRRRWYPSGKKDIPEDVSLSGRSLAEWCWGDGGLDAKGYRITFCTESFAEASVRNLAERLTNMYGWKPTFLRPSGRFRLAISRHQDRVELVKLIRPFCPPCFEYKLLIAEER